MSVPHDAEPDYSKLSDSMFDDLLIDVVADAGVAALMSIPEVDTIVREHYNNAVLEAFETKHPELAYHEYYN